MELRAHVNLLCHCGIVSANVYTKVVADLPLARWVLCGAEGESSRLFTMISLFAGSVVYNLTV